jgi:arsenate reductase
VNVLFVCVENAGRSQIAEALFSRLVDDGRHAARSAGSDPAERLHSQATEVLAESGINIRGRVPRRLEHADVEWADVVVTMGCNGACPVVDGKRYLDWGLPDVRDATLEETRAIRDRLATLVIDLALELDARRG